jgi:hypothetical protein
MDFLWKIKIIANIKGNRKLEKTTAVKLNKIHCSGMMSLGLPLRHQPMKTYTP